LKTDQGIVTLNYHINAFVCSVADDNCTWRNYKKLQSPDGVSFPFFPRTSISNLARTIFPIFIAFQLPKLEDQFLLSIASWLLIISLCEQISSCCSLQQVSALGNQS